MTYTSQYPPVQSATYVNANFLDDTGKYVPWNATDPAKSLTGDWDHNMWYQLGNTDHRFHIDLGSGFIIRRIYYENNHLSGTNTQFAVKTFTFWGSNNVADFNDLTYADDGTWTQLPTSQPTFDQHVAADTPDPKFILITNVTTYRYYGFKIADGWGGVNMGIRRIELQTEDGFTPPSTIAASRRLILL